MRGSLLLVGALFGMAAAWAPAAPAEPITFALMKNQSRTTFKSDAPLETVVGTATAEGLDGALTVDPARPQAATGMVRVDMNRVRTGIDQRDADMRNPSYLDTGVEANRWVTFEVTGVEIAGPLQPSVPVPVRVRGILTVKQRPVERVAEATVTYVKLAPEQLEIQKRFGFTADNIKVRARLGTTFTDHGIRIPQLLFLKLADELGLEADLTFIRAR